MKRVLPCLPILALALSTPAAARAELAAGGALVVDGGDLESAAAPEAADPCVLAEAEAPPAAAAAPTLAAASAAAAQTAPAPRPMAVEYSDGYRTRLKIHKYASFATLPIFVAQYAVGQSLYDGNASDGTRTAHKALVGATAALFTANTVTGIWNLREGRKDPNHRTKRMVHGLLMLAADAGFVATGILAPSSESEIENGFEQAGSSGDRSAHRTVAISSMAVATVSYLMMLIH